MITFTAEKLKQARDSGYTDDEIWGFTSQQDDRFIKAKEAGYSLDEVSGFFSEQQAPQEPATPAESAPPVGTSFMEEVAAIPQAIRQAVDQPLEAMGETAEVLGAPSVGGALRGAVDAAEGYVSAAQRFMEPQEGEFQIGGFAPQFLPRAIVEQAGQIAGAIATRAVGGAVGGIAGATLGPKGAVAGAVAGQFLGPALFEMSQIVGPVARERAANQGREEPTTDDLAWAWSTAGASGALNAIGAKYLPNGDKLVGGLAKRIAASVAGEGTTEGLQSTVQQVGQSFLTEQGLQLKPKESFGEAIMGGGAGGATTLAAAPFTKASAAAETKVAAEQAASVAPETAQAVSEQANQVIAQAQAEETTETPDERVARLQREAREAAGEIELEEDVSGLPPVEPTPPVTPTPEAAVAPVEPQPIVTEETPPPAPEPTTEAAAPPQPTVAGFTTAKGSTYEVTPEGKTIRTKRSEGRGQGETYEPHSVLFVPSETNYSILSDVQGGMGDYSIRMGYSEGNRFIQVTDTNQIPADVTPQIAIVSRSTQQIIPNGVYDAQRNPEVGFNPVEKLYKPDGTSSTHLGNQITEIRPIAEAAPAAVEPTPVAPPPVTPQLEPLRRVARAEQTEEDVAGLVGQGLVELYKGQPVITQAGLDALPEAERPRLTPEARKIQIDTRTSEAAAEAISKNLRIGVDQVPVDVRMPEGWTLEGDVYVPPQPQAVTKPEQAVTPPTLKTKYTDNNLEAVSLPRASGQSNQARQALEAIAKGSSPYAQLAQEIINAANTNPEISFAISNSKFTRSTPQQDRGRFRGRSFYEPAYRTISMNPKQAGDTRIALHEIIHAIISHKLPNKISSTKLKGKKYKKALDEAIADQALPKPLRDIIRGYVIAVEKMGADETLWGAGPDAGITSQTLNVSAKYLGAPIGAQTKAQREGGRSYRISKKSNVQKLLRYLKENGITEVDVKRGFYGRGGRAHYDVIIANSDLEKIAVEKKQQGKHPSYYGNKGYDPTNNSLTWSIKNKIFPVANDPDAVVEYGFEYGLGNIDEFLSEALSNPEFQKALNEIEMEGGKTVWQTIIDAIARILGIEVKAGSVLDVISRSAFELATEGDLLLAGGRAPTPAPTPEVREARMEPAITPQQDRDYLDAVERGDLDAASRVIDDLVRASGAVPVQGMRVYRGSVAMTGEVGGAGVGSVLGSGVYVTSNREAEDRLAALDYAGGKLTRGEDGNIQEFVADLENAFVLDTNKRYNLEDLIDDQRLKPWFRERLQSWLDKGWYSNGLNGGNIAALIQGGMKGHGKRADIGKAGFDAVVTFQDGEVYEAAVTNPELLKPVETVLTREGVPQRGAQGKLVQLPSGEIKSADPVTYDDQGNIIPLSKRFQPEQADIRYSYAGVRAQTPQFMRDSLSVAQAMAAKGEDAETIRSVTGWIVNPYDGKLRWEIPDNDAKIWPTAKREDSTTVETMLSLPDNFEELRAFYGWKQYQQKRQNQSAYEIILDWVKETNQKELDDATKETQGLPIAELQKRSMELQRKKQERDQRITDFYGGPTAVENTNRKLNRIPLSYILDHPSLYEAYPDIAWLPVSFNAQDIDMENVGVYDNIQNFIGLNPVIISKSEELQNARRIVSTLLHEIQHWIQNKEGFSAGASPQAFRNAPETYQKWLGRRELMDLSKELGVTPIEAVEQYRGLDEYEDRKRDAELWQQDPDMMSDETINRNLKYWRNRGKTDMFTAYERTAGEIESRDVQARMKMTPEQRKATAPYSSENISPEDAVIMGGEGGVAELRGRRVQMGRAGMETSAVEARLQELGLPTGGIIRVVNEPDADFEGRTIILDGKVTGIELNASALKDNAAIDRVLNHEFAESANADGALNKLVERLTSKEKKEINDTITRLRYEERARSAEEAARAIETLAEAWKGRGFFTRAVARVEAWASKLGFKLTRRAAEYIAARNLAEVNENVRKWHISDALANLNGARRVTFNGLSAVLIPPSEMRLAYSIAAYHGTPHRIKGGFQLKYVGTGEGATAYGWGLYFAENQQVAEQYRKQLSYKDNKAYQDSQNKPIEELLPVVFAEGNTINIFGTESKVKSFEISEEDFTAVLEDGRVINKNTLAQSTLNVRSQYMQMFGGNIYNVDLDINENELLDWDLPISEQSKFVKNALEKAGWTSKGLASVSKMYGNSGKGLYDAIDDDLNSKQAASESLLKAGIKGIRYLDQGSRVNPKDIAKLQELRTEVQQLTETIEKNAGKEWAERKMFTDWLVASSRDLASMEKFVEVNKTTYNYVVFDENLIKITGLNGQPVDIRESRREPEAIPTFTEGTPEAATLKEMAASMAKVDAASKAKGGKPETYKISEIASVWMDSGLGERELQDAIVEYTNLTPANAAKVAKAIAKQYGIQQQLVEAAAPLAEIAPEPEGAPRKSAVTKLIEQTTGVRKPVVKLQVSESAALKKQIQLKAREARETRKARKEAAEDLAKAITDYVKANPIRGPINSRQAMSITKKALKLDVNNEAAVDRFEMYVERVIENANYDRDLADARALIKRAKTFAKSKDTQGNVKTTLEAIANIAPTLLDNPFEFNLVVQRYLLGLAPVTAKQYAVMPDADVRRYLESLETQIKDNQEMLDRAKAQRILDKQAAYAEEKGIPLDEAIAILNSEEFLEEKTIEKLEDLTKLLTAMAQESQKDVKAYDDSGATPKQKELISFMRKVNLDSLLNEQKKQYIRSANNLLANGATFGMEQFQSIALGQEAAMKAAKDKRLSNKLAAWISPIGGDKAIDTARRIAAKTQSEADTFKNIFGREAVGVFRNILGLNRLDVAQTDSNRAKEQIANEFGEYFKGLRKKYGDDATGFEAKGYAGIAGYLIQTDGNKTEAESIPYRRRLMEQNIVELRKSDKQADLAEADLKERALAQLTGTTNAEILSQLKALNPASYEQLMWVKDTMLPKWRDFLKEHDENFRNQANNYNNPDHLTITYKFPEGQLLPSEMEDVYQQDMIGMRIKQAANSIKRKDHPNLPVSKSGTIANIDINFGYNQYNALVDQVDKAYVAPAWEQVVAFSKDPNFEQVVGGRANALFVKNLLRDIQTSRSRQSITDDEAQMIAGGVRLARKISTQAVLGGFTQPLRQVPDQLSKLFFTTGRWDLITKNLLATAQAAPLLNKFPISRRGDAQAGTQYASQFSELARKVEASVTDRKWAQYRELMNKVGEFWMTPLRGSDVWAAKVSWMSYYESELNKKGIKMESWEREAELVDTDQDRKEAAAYAEFAVDFYGGASDPTKMASLSKQTNNGWKEFAKLLFLPLNSFALQQKNSLISDLRDAYLRTGDRKASIAAVAGTLAGMAAFHGMRIYIIGGLLYPAGKALLMGIFGIDMDEPDEEEKQKQLEDNWRKFKASMYGNIVAGGLGEFVEKNAIDAVNRTAYLWDANINPDSLLNDKGEIMSFRQYEKEVSPLYRFRSYGSSEYSFGLADVLTEQATHALAETQQLMTPEEMEKYTGNEQAYAAFATGVEWMYFFRLMDTDVKRIATDLKRQMDKSVEEREKEIRAIQSGR